jgi:endonuclease III
MVDPENITKYDLTDWQLEEHALFWICAAGKNGRTASRCLNNLLHGLAGHFNKRLSPFTLIKKAAKEVDLPQWLKDHGIGCYTSKAKSFTQLVNSGLDLRKCSADDLETIHGIGMKTSRCFILHSRYGARYAGLDTHILKYLRLAGVKDVPKSTPPSKKQYLRLEKEFLKIADLNEMTPADFDLAVWNQYSVKSKQKA